MVVIATEGGGKRAQCLGCKGFGPEGEDAEQARQRLLAADPYSLGLEEIERSKIMRIELQWAFVEADIPDEKPCTLCEAEFKGDAVVIRVGPHGDEACAECLRNLSLRKEQEPWAPWPSFEEYQVLLKSHPEPMFATEEELDASETLDDPPWAAHDASLLWTEGKGPQRM
jgi:hypothetical protein